MPSNTQQQGAEACASEQSFRQLAEAIGAVFRITEAIEGRMIYLSPGFEEIWGRSRESLYASPNAWLEAIYPEDRERMTEITLGLNERGGYDEEYRIQRPDGSTRWVRDRAFPVRNETGNVYRLASIIEDITERKLLEREVIEINDRERSRLGQDLHDGICQQLVSIAFATDLLRRDLIAKSPGEAVRAAKINALLDSAITQARNLSHALCPVNLAGDRLAAAEAGLPDPKVTSDAKHVEIGLTDKSDSSEWVMDWLWRCAPWRVVSVIVREWFAARIVPRRFSSTITPWLRIYIALPRKRCRTPLSTPTRRKS